jgi:hypothetical protein
MSADGCPDCQIGDGVYISTNSAKAKFQRFTDSGSAAHERVENCPAACLTGLIEELEHVGAGRARSADEDSAEYGAEPLSPPLVNVVDRAVDLLPPALGFSDLADVFEREVGGLYGRGHLGQRLGAALKIR